MINVGVIGCGYWGPNLIRNFHNNQGSNVSQICDLRDSRLKFINQQYPLAELTKDYRDITRNPSIDAVAIATPVTTHFAIAEDALLNGKSVLLEKPMTYTVKEAERLIELAEQKGLTLMIDHTFVYTGAVQKIKEIVDNGELGEIYYFDSVRINLGLFQHDINVVWDLAPHDLSIMDYLLQKDFIDLDIIAVSHLSDSFENTAYLTLFFENNTIAHIHVNWLAPVKIRNTIIGGSKKMIVYNDMETSEKVKIFDRGVDIQQDETSIYKMLVQYRVGDMYAPKLSQVEALTVEVEHFLDCMINKTKPITDGYSGLRVVRALETAQKKLDKKKKG